MIKAKTFVETLNIERPCAFMVNKYDNTIRRLKTVYEKKCFRGTYILEVDKINKISDCEIIASNLRSIGIINVEFEAKVINYSEGDIIADTVIIIKDNIPYCKSEFVLCALGTDKNNTILIDGNVVPMIVDHLMYNNTNREKVNIYAKILLPLTSSPIYQVDGSLDSKDYPLLKPYVDLIENYQPNLKSTDRFIKLLSKKKTPSKTAKSFDLVEFIKDNSLKKVDVTGFWQKDLSQEATSAGYIKLSEPPMDNNYVSIKTTQAFTDMLVLIIQMRRGAIDLQKVYGDEEKYKQAGAVWDLMKLNQE